MTIVPEVKGGGGGGGLETDFRGPPLFLSGICSVYNCHSHSPQPRPHRVGNICSFFFLFLFFPSSLDVYYSPEAYKLCLALFRTTVSSHTSPVHGRVSVKFYRSRMHDERKSRVFFLSWDVLEKKGEGVEWDGSVGTGGVGGWITAAPFPLMLCMSEGQQLKKHSVPSVCFVCVCVCAGNVCLAWFSELQSSRYGVAVSVQWPCSLCVCRAVKCPTPPNGRLALTLHTRSGARGLPHPPPSPALSDFL